jgi:hypothetical protein
MAAAAVPPIVSPQWLAERLGQPDIKVLDVSWYMPAMGEQGVSRRSRPSALRAVSSGCSGQRQWMLSVNCHLKSMHLTAPRGAKGPCDES